jgi:DNA-directed RNA polymerase subunit F
MDDKKSVSLDKLTKAYIKIREARAELSAKFKERDEELSSQMDLIKSALLG